MKLKKPVITTQEVIDELKYGNNCFALNKSSYEEIKSYRGQTYISDEGKMEEISPQKFDSQIELRKGIKKIKRI